MAKIAKRLTVDTKSSSVLNANNIFISANNSANNNRAILCYIILLCLMPDYFTLSNIDGITCQGESALPLNRPFPL
jgi:hypothetical protein